MGRIIDRRRVMGGESLPYDAEIEYLESTGTQWIDTGIVPSSSLRVLDRYKSEELLNAQGHSGIRDNANWAWGDRENGKYTVILSSTWNDLMTRNNQIHVFDIKSGAQYIDGVRKGTVVFNGNESYFKAGLPIFGKRSYGNYEGQKCKRYYIKIWKNNLLVRDYIPVRVGQVGYMYDKVSKQLFGNAGTGDFILGPDK